MNTADFACFLCGYSGPHPVAPVPPHPAQPDLHVSPLPPLIRCGACLASIWEPDTGDGVAEPNLTCIRPELREWARQALQERDAGRFLLLADSHLRPMLATHNTPLLERLELWDAIVVHFRRR